MFKNTYKRVDGSDLELQADQNPIVGVSLRDPIPLKDFNLVNKTNIGSSEPHEVNNKRLYYSTNRFIKAFQRFKDGPCYPMDDPPSARFATIEALNRFHSKIIHETPPKLRKTLILLFLLIWFGLAYTIISPQLKNGALTNNDQVEVVTLSCTGNDYLWKGKNQKCALNGELCAPFSNRDIIIKCPAFCDRDAWIFSSTPVGNEMIKYRQYIIGGGKQVSNDGLSLPYRGDSSPCAAALHSGIISPYVGGCVKLSLNGTQLSFSSRAGEFDTGFSIGFPSFFPSSFIFRALDLEVSNCQDLRLLLLIVNVIFGFIMLFITQTSHMYWILTLVGYWTVVLALDPPITYDANKEDTVHELISVGFARLLPLSFILYLYYKNSVSTTLGEPNSMFWKAMGWYPMFWLGISNNITFDRLPVDRLTVNDIKQRPSGLVAIIFIILSLFVGIGFQIHRGWHSGKLYRYLKGYFFVIIGLILLTRVRRMELRIHHYILGLILIPATATKNTSAYLFQGVLLGLLISGVAKWDFASIIETDVSLLRGEAGSLAPPPKNFTLNNGILSWNKATDVPSYDTMNGYSLLINDIERYIGNETSLNLKDLIESDPFLQSTISKSLSKENTNIPLYLRLGRASLNKFSLERSDYTMAAVVYWPDGNWTSPVDGTT